MQTGGDVGEDSQRSSYRTRAVTPGNPPQNFSSSRNPARWQLFFAGFRDVLGPMVATVTWGFVTGIAMVKSGLSELMATIMTLTVFAGSAQLTALPLLEASAPLWLIFAAGFVVNIRFIIFGAALYPYVRHLSWQRRLGLGYLSADMVFVLFMNRYGEHPAKNPSDHIWYMLGVAIPSWLSWMIFSLLGVVASGFMPDSWSLEFAAILALLGVVIPLIKTRPMVVCMAVSGAVAWAGQPLPLRLGLLLAVIAGIIAGVMAETMRTGGKGKR